MGEIKNRGLYSIILLSYYSENRIIKVYENLKEALDSHNIPFELIIIDDGSKDKSHEIALSLEKTDNRVRAYQLSRNFTSHYAKFAGLSISKGDCATSIPDDFQLPIEVIIKMYRAWENGEKIVIPYRKKRQDNLFKSIPSKLYYYLMNKYSHANYPEGGADAFLADREIIDKLNEIKPLNTSSTVEVLSLGYDPYFFPFERPKSTASKSRWTLSKRITLAKDTFFSASLFPIKMITRLGILSFLSSITLIIISVYLKVKNYDSFAGISIPGWTSTITIISFFSGLILFSMGILAEYIYRIFEEVKGRPGYIIKNKPES